MHVRTRLVKSDYSAYIKEFRRKVYAKFLLVITVY
jgi:hypothetical protein